jgi:hypothetical protein
VGIALALLCLGVLLLGDPSLGAELIARALAALGITLAIVGAAPEATEAVLRTGWLGKGSATPDVSAGVEGAAPSFTFELKGAVAIYVVTLLALLLDKIGPLIADAFGFLKKVNWPKIRD